MRLLESAHIQDDGHALGIDAVVHEVLTLSKDRLDHGLPVAAGCILSAVGAGGARGVRHGVVDCRG